MSRMSDQEHQRGTLVILSGFSGAGKGTVLNRLLSLHDNYALSVSATTRKPREGEKEGVSYFFKTEEEFQRMVTNDEFLEYARYVDHSYGTPAAYVDEQLDAGKDVILEIEIQGALKVKKKRPEAVLIFVTPPSAAELRKRLTGRGTETQDVIDARMRRAAEEAGTMPAYDYILVNDDVDICAEKLHELIQTQHLRTAEQKKFIQKITEELAADRGQ